MRRRVFLLVLNLFSLGGYAVTISGLVTDEVNHPLPYANVYLKGTTQGATTNAEGQYSISLQPGNYQLVFSYVGYLQVIKNVTVENVPVQLNVQLQPERIELKEV
ncbi:MAG: carboxypeptidase-like regulatory domain-containing protein, partial [Chitinophagales bacterium]